MRPVIQAHLVSHSHTLFQTRAFCCICPLARGVKPGALADWVGMSALADEHGSDAAVLSLVNGD